MFCRILVKIYTNNKNVQKLLNGISAIQEAIL